MKIIHDNDLNKPHHQVEFTDLELAQLIECVCSFKTRAYKTGFLTEGATTLVNLEFGLRDLLNDFLNRKEIRSNTIDIMLRKVW